MKAGDKVKLKKSMYDLNVNDIYEISEVDSYGQIWLQGSLKYPRGTCHIKEEVELVSESVKTIPKPNKGLRYNTDKLRWRNFPMFLMKPLIEVAQYGEEKYDTYNFLKGQTMSDSLDSLKRHLELLESPYESDIDESGVNHLAHVAWNALVALHMLSVRPDLDDRYTATPEETELYQKAKEAQKRGR